MENPSAVLHAVGDIRIEDRPVPHPGPGQVQVAVHAVGVCGSDVHYYEHGRIGTMVVEAPMVLGHEAAGVVTEVGEGVDAARLGELVALEPGLPCRHCVECRSGRYNLCPDVRFFATPPVDGAFARYVVTDADFAYHAPAGLDAAAAAMAEPVSVGVWSARKGAVAPGSRVLVTGAGPIGLICAQVARAFGAASVEISDVNEHRLAVAAALGLDATDARSGRSDEVDVLIECSGSAAALTAAVPRMARAGRIVVVGMGAEAVAIDLGLLQSRELWVTGTFRYANTYPTALELIASGAVALEPLLTGRYPLAEAERALRAAHEDPRALKAIVLPWA
ncbi:NAD(P)-dependent alcohol dehydrogenase [Microbacterium sp. 18062]|uniref:NAD(P)-dependent alcohol dehydrogenase n=1 Tax=Microbacterium sp. 18062 TaxID=2681410 RepID=UPI00135BAAF5|nr:NAD(P)-dependent alcohol dehydrogenase [Microbacterium sp. 18062]